jgi:hypothetical protein
MARHVRLSSQVTEVALAHLSASDPVMRQLIASVGPFGLKPIKNRFRALVRSIVSQQISSKAAASILRKLETLVEPDGGVSPESILRLSVARMRKAGLSPQKQAYLHNLAEPVHSRKVRLDRLSRLPDEEVIAELIQVKGIGRWTSVFARPSSASTDWTNCPTKRLPTELPMRGDPTPQLEAGIAGAVSRCRRSRPEPLADVGEFAGRCAD